VYDASPLEAAKQFAAAGLRRLHIVDLDGAISGAPKNLDILESIVAHTDLKIDFGGGIRTEADVKRAFEAGAVMVSIGSITVKEPDVFFGWLTRYGRGNFLLGADFRNNKLAINGWQTDTHIDLLPFLADYAARGVEQAFVTDIGKDGRLQGPAFSMYREIRRLVPDLKLIASGGVRSTDDIEQLALDGCAGVIIGKALYEGKVKLEELSKYVGQTDNSLS
jgi:phosphoribosylformimino-5-aminoimidazole carboxamide ribotide isomerase